MRLLKRLLVRWCRKIATMTTLIAPSPIDQDTLRRIDALRADPVIPPPSEGLVEAQALFRVAFDSELVASLKRAALLLRAKVPGFDCQVAYEPGQLQAIVDAADVLQQALQQTTIAVKKARKSSTNPALAEISQSVETAMAQAYAHAEKLRWAAMSAQAEAEIEAGGGKSFASMDAALACLSKIR